MLNGAAITPTSPLAAMRLTMARFGELPKRTMRPASSRHLPLPRIGDVAVERRHALPKNVLQRSAARRRSRSRGLPAVERARGGRAHQPPEIDRLFTLFIVACIYVYM